MYIDELIREKNLAEKLCEIIAGNKRQRSDFISSLMNKKQELNNLFGIFANAFANKEDFCNWYYDYLYVYYEWFRKYFEEESIDNVLAMVPTISPWAFEAKCKQREMGQLPGLFGTRNDFQKFCDKLIKSSAFKAFKKVKDLELNESLKPVKNHAKDPLKEKQKAVMALLKDKMGNDFSLKCGKVKFDIHPMFNPFSNKVVLRLVAENGDKFILKISPYNNSAITSDIERKSHENQLIRADSPYTNACVDFYLKYNGCSAVADILYYDFVYDAVLYKENDSKTYKYPNRIKEYKNTLKFNLEEIKCITDLGLFLNDVREENLLINKATKQIQLIDSGHMSYISPLNPGCPGYTITMGNLCGRDTIGHFGLMMSWMK
ncbi:MAG: hypothetical protein IKA03_06975 [Alphaproteobacteria bacterium]|nr:hypothetical protein [Alphaproteobacteria bacterium]